MMLNCDMSAAYISEDGGHNWRMITHVTTFGGSVWRGPAQPTEL